MSFGFSVGDFVTIGQLCWNLYKACKAAAGEYEEISRELGTLHVTLKNLEEEAANPMSILNRRGVGRKADMDSILNSIKPVLEDLEKMLLKYNSLGKMEKRKWDRLRFGTVDLDNVRGKLTFHASVLDLFMSNLSAGSLAKIETALEEIMFEIKAGRRARTVLSVQDEGTDSAAAWKELKADLLDSGITKKDIEKYKDSIRSYIIELVAGETMDSGSTARGSRLSFIASSIDGGSESTDDENWDSISQRGCLEKNQQQEPANISAILLAGVDPTETQDAASPKKSPPKTVPLAAAKESMTAAPSLTASLSLPQRPLPRYQSLPQQNSIIKEGIAAASADEQSHTRTTEDFLWQFPNASPFEKFTVSAPQFLETELAEKPGESSVALQEVLEHSNESIGSLNQRKASNPSLNAKPKFHSIERLPSNSGEQRPSDESQTFLTPDTCSTRSHPRSVGSRHRDVRERIAEKETNDKAKVHDGQAAPPVAANNGYRPSAESRPRVSIIDVTPRGLDHCVRYNASDVDGVQNEEAVEARSAQLLLENGFNIKQMDFDKQIAFFWAADSGHESIVRLLLEKGANIEAKDRAGWTALYRAAYKGDKVIVRLLLENGANIEAKTRDKWTALYSAASKGHEAVVRLLLENGANIAAKAPNKWTALYSAACKGHEAVVRLLLENGANIEAKGRNKLTALHRAANKGDEAVVRLLLENGANIEAKAPNKWTALYSAASKGHEAVVRLLLEKGANIEAKDRAGRTALCYAVEGKQDKIVELLQQARPSRMRRTNLLTKPAGYWRAGMIDLLKG